MKALIYTLLFLFAGTAFAQYQKINTEVLPKLWYSSVNILENQNIKIFAGVQNHSSSTLNFKGSFYVDNKEIYKIEESSKPDTLLEVSAPWKSVYGSHDIQFKITSSDENIDTLISKESTKNNIFVAKDLSVEGITEKAKEVVASTTDSFVKKIDDSINNFTEKIADKVLGFKSDPISDGQVLGASTTYKAPTMINKVLNNKTVASVWDMILNFFSYIIRNWKISVVVIFIIIFLLKFML